jgi:hypothetical protein
MPTTEELSHLKPGDRVQVTETFEAVVLAGFGGVPCVYRPNSTSVYLTCPTISAVEKVTKES